MEEGNEKDALDRMKLDELLFNKLEKCSVASGPEQEARAEVSAPAPVAAFPPESRAEHVLSDIIIQRWGTKQEQTTQSYKHINWPECLSDMKAAGQECCTTEEELLSLKQDMYTRCAGQGWRDKHCNGAKLLLAGSPLEFTVSLFSILLPQGSFVDGFMHGYGEYTWANGVKYEVCRLLVDPCSEYNKHQCGQQLVHIQLVLF